VKGANCGVWGCGFLNVFNLDADKKTSMAWMESLLPPPPPSSTTARAARLTGIERKQQQQQKQQQQRRRRSSDDPSDLVGLTLAEIDLTTGITTATRPLGLNASGPQDMGGTFGYDAEEQHMWFACEDPDGVHEGVCRADASKGAKEGTLVEKKWGNVKYTITSLGWSNALKSVVVLAQELSSTDGPVDTKVFQADPKSSSKEWPVLADLGKTCYDLHQATVSADGRYMMANVGSGNCDGYPQGELVTVDMVSKKVVGRIVVKDTTPATGLALLAAIPC
jgi:hypothetical protein